MNAEQYLNEALGGNMNISTLKPLAWHEIMEGYARQKLAEALKPSHNQLQAKIRAYYAELSDMTDVDGILISDVMAKLRELSAVQ